MSSNKNKKLKQNKNNHISKSKSKKEKKRINQNLKSSIKIEIENNNLLFNATSLSKKKVYVTDDKTINEEKKSIAEFPFNSNTINSVLKYIIIDGSNVAMEHGIKNFSAKGIKLAIEFFQKRGHTKIKALLPRFRRSSQEALLDDLESKGFLSYTPSRYLNGKLIVPYDDRFILEAADYYNAVIVSNDNYNDIKHERPSWRQLVDNNLLQFAFVGDLFMVADDPMGKYGPSLDEFLIDSQSNKPDLNNNTIDLENEDFF